MNNDNIGVKPCPSCGRNLRSDATFCYMCGYNFVTKKGGNNIQPKIDIKEDEIFYYRTKYLDWVTPEQLEIKL